MKKYYEILQVKENVSPMSLRDATRDAIKIHYDRLNRESLMMVCEAYIILSDIEEKAKYDATTDEEYEFHDPAYLQKRVKSLSDAICDQVRDLGRHYKDMKVTYFQDIIYQWGLFGISFFVAWFCRTMRFKWIIFLFPVVALKGFLKGFSNIVEIVLSIKNEKNYFENEIWKYIDLPQ